MVLVQEFLPFPALENPFPIRIYINLAHTYIHPLEFPRLTTTKGPPTLADEVL